MDKLHRISIKEQIYDIVKRRIYAQEYSFGDQIKIMGLAKEFGTSNTPVREALSMLAAEGLLTTTMNNKFKVIEISKEKMAELNEMILVLLCGTYMQAIRQGREEKLFHMLENAYHEQEEARNANNEEKYIEKTMLFDRCFVSVEENHMLNEIYDKYTSLLYLYVKRVLSNSNVIKENMEEHRLLMEAVRNKEHGKVHKLLETHYDKGYEKKVVEEF